MRVSAGEKLGPYELLSPLGAGGMGEVWKARDTRLDRIVAIKVSRERFSERFEREARVIAALNHPHICTLFDVGPNYLVMEYVEGHALRGPLPLKTALQYAVQVADALHAAHVRGVIHRDLKPDNILVTKAGIKLLDFGLAKVAAQSAVSDATATIAEPLTKENSILGTLQYMSPEQLEGKDADARSDIFAFGLVLYETVTGKAAFQAGSQASLIAAILKEEPPPLSTLQPLLPAALDRVVRKCMAKDPEARWQSTADLRDELRWISETPSDTGAASTAPTPSRALRKWLPAVVLALVIGLAGGIFWQSSRAPASAPAKYSRLAFRAGLYFTARFAPDGRTVVYTAALEGQPFRVFSTAYGAPESRDLGLPDDTAIQSISSIGEMALLVHLKFGGSDWAGTLARAPLSGGAPREMIENVSSADWSPDGANLAIVRQLNNQSCLEYPIGKTLYQIAQGGLHYAKVSPSGERVAFVEDKFGLSTVSVVGLSGKKVELISGLRADTDGLAWSPSGEEVWFSSEGALHAVTLSGHHRVVIYSNGGFWQHVDIARDGKVLFVHVQSRRALMFHASGAASERDLSWLGLSYVTDISSDSKLLTLAELSERRSPEATIYVRRTDGSPAVSLGHGHLARLSPDGRWVLAAIEARGLKLLPVGAGEVMSLPSPQLTMFACWSWFPDGKRIIFSGLDGPAVADLHAIRIRRRAPSDRRHVLPLLVSRRLIIGRVELRNQRKVRLVFCRRP
jgi:predicted Ser/Thr protein kinase